MNSALELHDSKVESVNRCENVIEILLSPALVHISLGLPCVDAGKVYCQSYLLRFSGAKWLSSDTKFIGRISEAKFKSTDGEFAVLRLPCSRAGPLTAEFALDDGQVFRLSATEIVAVPVGVATFLDNFPE